MKKVLALLIVLLLTVVLVGCEDDGNYWRAVEYYTQEEVDELIQNAIDELGEEIENDIPQQYYSKDEIDMLLQSINSDNQTYQCDLVNLIIDVLKAIDTGYTYEFVDGQFIEYKNGVATGDVFDNVDLIDYYCVIG